MKQTILQQMATYGLAVEFSYGGEARYDGNYRRTALASSVHSWNVRITSRRREGVSLEDFHSATVMEYTKSSNDITVLVDKYLRTLLGRVERVRLLGTKRTFTGWCKLMGLRPADLGNQEFWRYRFDQDCRAARDLAALLGGDDKVEELLSTTIR